MSNVAPQPKAECNCGVGDRSRAAHNITCPGRKHTKRVLRALARSKASAAGNAVEILDEWAFCHPGHSFNTELDSSGFWVCSARNVSELYVGATPDEARAKAATAVEAGKV